MRLAQGADVYSANGDRIGSIERVVIDPNTRQITHLVIDKGYFETSKIVSMDAVDLDQEEKITLHLTLQDVDNFHDYESSQYVTLDADEYPEGEAPPVYWYPPMNSAWWRSGVYAPYPGMPIYTLKTDQNIPEGTVALDQGARLLSRDDKHVGNIEELIVDPEDNRVTHLVVSEGLLFKERKLIPVTWISNMDEDAVHLSVGSGTLDKLPAYENVGRS